MFDDYRTRIVQLNTKRMPCYGRVKNKNGRYSTVTLSLCDRFVTPEEGEPGRWQKGHNPLFFWVPEKQYTYYSFESWAEINNKHGDHIEVYLYAVDEYGTIHDFGLDSEETVRVLKKLNSQCKRVFGKDLEGLLEAARERMNPAEL